LNCLLKDKVKLDTLVTTLTAMSSIYTARPIYASSEKPVPLFAIKGLTTFAPAQLSSLSIQGVPLQREISASVLLRKEL